MSVPHLPVQLPSGYRTYHDVHSENITVRPYTGEDESVLAQINPANIEKNFLVVLTRVISGIDPRNLTLGDRLYLIIWEYINSYSETVQVRQTCSNCMEVVTFPVDLRKLEIKKLNPDLAIPTPVQLPVQGATVHLRPLTVGDEIAVEKIESAGDAFLYRFARSFVGVDDHVQQMVQMKTWPAKDVARIRYYHDVEADHGPITSIKMGCPHCKEVEEVEVPFRLDFFHPEGSALGTCFGA